MSRAIFVLVAIVGFLGVSYAVFGGLSTGSVPPEKAIPAFARATGIVLPSDARCLTYSFDLNAESYLIKLRFDESGLKSFLDDNHYDKEDWSGRVSYSINHDWLPGWTPQNLVDFQAAQVARREPGSKTYTNILIDRSKAPVYDVYLERF